MTDPATPKYLLAYHIIAGVNNVVYITDDGGLVAVTLTAGEYFLAGDASATCLLQHLEDRFTAVGAATWQVTKSATNKVTIEADDAWEVNWSHASTTLPATVFGAADNTTDTTAAANTSAALDYQHQYGWYAGQAVEADSFADASAPVSQVVTPGALVHTVRQGAVHGVRAVSHLWEAKAKAHPATATTNESWREFVEWASDGRRCRYYPSAAASTNYDCVLDASTIAAAKPGRHSPGVELYSWPVALKEYA